MQSFTLHSVPEIIFGAGALAGLGEHVTARAGKGAPVMIVADPVLATLGVTARLIAALKDAGHAASLYDGFKGEPKAADVDAAAAAARAAGARLVIGIGGGSALDTAKLVASAAAAGEKAEAYQLCATPLPADHLPIIAVPTTAGTGSEVTRTSVFTNSAGEKVWAWGNELKPGLAVLDPELTTGIPPFITAATGIDALVHAMEAATNNRANIGNSTYCLRAISLISRNLEKAVKTPGDLEARGAMLLGSTFAGVAIDNCGTALAHNISHAMGSLAPIMHGRATGLAMLATIGWVAEGNEAAFAEVAAAMGEAPRAAAAIAAYDRLLRATGMSVSLAKDGLDLAKPELLAAKMAAPENAPMRNSTMRKVEDSDLLPLARKVYALA